MAEKLEVKNLDQVVVRFSGDSGDGMQLAGNIFSTVSATVGNGISTFPDYPADIRAPQGSLTGVSGFQVHIGEGKVYTPGDLCDVLVAMNAAALKTQYRYAKPGATIIIDTDSFGPKDLEKAQFKTEDYLGEMGIDPDRVIQCPLTTMVKQTLMPPTSDDKTKEAPSGAVGGANMKDILKCRNMFALGLVCWLFDRDLNLVNNFLREKFAKKPAIAEANIKVIQAGWDYGHNTHSSAINVYRIETKHKEPGRYMDITGNKATAYGFIAAAEKAGLNNPIEATKYVSDIAIASKKLGALHVVDEKDYIPQPGDLFTANHGGRHVMMFIGIYFYRRTQNMSDYILGSRKLGAWVISMSAEAEKTSGVVRVLLTRLKLRSFAITRAMMTAAIGSVVACLFGSSHHSVMSSVRSA